MIDAIVGRLVERLTAGQTKRFHHECRRCGTTVSRVVDDCPQCGTRDIARIALQ
jgi:rubrerythrin